MIGKVVTQKPAAFTRTKSGSKITIVVGKRPLADRVKQQIRIGRDAMSKASSVALKHLGLNR